MDYYSVIVGTVAGGLAGLVYGLFGFNSKSVKGKVGLILGVVTFTGLTSLSNVPAVKNPIMSLFDKNYAKKALLFKNMEKLVELPVVKTKLKTLTTAEEANAYTSKLVHDGLKRLSDNDLIKWNEVRLKLAKASPNVCSGLWNGRVKQNEIIDGLASLDEVDIEDWSKVSISAAKHELDQKKHQAISQTYMTEGLLEIAKLQDDDGKNRMQLVLKQGTTAKESDACWMIKTIMEGSTKIEKKKSLNLLRFLANL